MEKESTTSRHVGMCKKLFNVFNPASRSHRRLALHDGHKPEATINIPSPTKPYHSLDSGIKEPGPQKALPTPVVKPRLPPAPDQKKPSEAIAPKAEPKPTTPPPPPPPPPPTSSVPVEKAPDKVALNSAGPKAATIPQPAPPKAAATPQPVPQPEGPKKNINERVDDYIKRARERMRTISGVGRTPPKAAATPQPERPKKNINERVEDYIKSARERMRTISGVGRKPTS